ncbi:MAG: zinc ribbon domain-containing protein [Lachnospiraceae bacterium]|nr:zinc ribbon domain-containing protein [Lachnospiraceae bacterium]
MKTCHNCGIDILDPTDRCPLCHSVLSAQPGQKDGPAMYPNVSRTVRKFRFLERVVLFASIVAMVALILANIMGEPFWEWTVIIGLILMYANFALRMSVTGRIGYQFKVFCLTFLAVAVLMGIDALTGYRGWSLNVILPTAVLFLDFSIFLLIFINRRNWQSYLSVEIFVTLLSLLLLLLLLIKVITYPNMVLIAVAVSVLLLAGTVILGGGRARRELYRRFHI